MDFNDYSQKRLGYQPVSEADYRAFWHDYLRAGGTITSQQLLSDMTLNDIYIAPNVRDFEMDKKKPLEKYYLFPNGTNALMSTRLNILSPHSPLSFRAPPFITRDILKDLKRDMPIEPLVHYFNGNIEDCLLVTYLLEGEEFYQKFAESLEKQIMQRFSVDQVKTIIGINKDISLPYNIYKKACVGQANIGNASYDQQAANLHSRINKASNRVYWKLKEAVTHFEAQEASIKKWEPFDTGIPRVYYTPERPWVMNEIEMARRITYEYFVKLPFSKGKR